MSRRRSFVCALPAITTLLLPACLAGDPSASAGPEPISETHEAYVDAQDMSITNGDLDTFRNLLDLGHFNLAVTGAFPWVATLTPSSGYTSLLYGDSNNLNPAYAQTMTLPYVTISPSWPAPDVTAWVDDIGFDFAPLTEGWTDALRLQFTGSSLAVDLHARGHLHIVASSALVPDVDVDVDDVALHVELVTDGAGRLALAPGDKQVTANVTAHVDSAISAVLPSLSVSLTTQIRTALARAIANANANDLTHHNVLQTFVEKKSNLSLSKTEPHYTVDPSTIRISDRLSWRATRVLPPVAAPVCTTSVLCGDEVAFACSSAESVVVNRLAPSAAPAVATSTAGTMLTLTDSPPTADTATYQVCATNSAGTLCAEPVTVSLPHTTCSRGSGSGSGGKTGCKGKICYGTG